MYTFSLLSSVFFFFRNTTLDVEVACLDISVLGEGTTSDLVAVGLWTDISARILRLPDLSEATKELLGGGNYNIIISLQILLLVSQ